MVEQIYRRLYVFSLDAMYKLDRRKTYVERLGHKLARKIFDNSFWYLYNYSPYDYRMNGEIEDE
jgi:hypothetical protein